MAGEILTLDQFIENKSLLVGSLKTNGEPTVGVVLAATGDAPQTLDDLLDAVGNGGKAQSTSSVVDMPPKESVDMTQLVRQLRNIQLLSTFANSYGMKLLYDERKGKPFDFANPDETGEFTRLAAKWIHYAITNSMGTFLTVTDSEETKMVKKYSQKEFHMEFLKELFGSFSFSASALQQLDSVLTNVFAQLSDIKITNTSQEATIDHLIYVYFFEDIPGIEKIKIAKLRLFYLHISNETWYNVVRVGKNSSTSAGFNFEMTYVDIKFEMNDENVEKNREKIEDVIQTMTDHNLEEVSKHFSPSVIDGNSQPA